MRALQILLVLLVLPTSTDAREPVPDPAPRPQWVEKDLHPGGGYRARGGGAIGCRSLDGFAAWDAAGYQRGGADLLAELRRTRECIVTTDREAWEPGPRIEGTPFVRLCRHATSPPLDCYLFRADAMALGRSAR